MVYRCLAAVLALALAAPAAAASPEAALPLGEGSYQATPQESLRLAQRELQMAAARLQKAKDFSGADAARQLQDGRKTADQALRRITDALSELQQTQNTDEAQQAIRNARLVLQSAKEALGGVRADAPEAAIQSLRDLQQATAEVRTTAEMAARPGGTPDAGMSR